MFFLKVIQEQMTLVIKLREIILNDIKCWTRSSSLEVIQKDLNLLIKLREILTVIQEQLNLVLNLRNILINYLNALSFSFCDSDMCIPPFPVTFLPTPHAITWDFIK
ncbi:hypothetical protein O6H91_08G036200 [Diphasiastrum complanatum]|uniref:Uncharacterized protein n=1 Tax=Diphasiastrum complanatum TaxID=34168 RepID=A0ACC2CWQ6_DIPCM|nr:hypothetical protein O6H91_08G036200 [Diphasiastrum complanatum]